MTSLKYRVTWWGLVSHLSSKNYIYIQTKIAVSELKFREIRRRTYIDWMQIRKGQTHLGGWVFTWCLLGQRSHPSGRCQYPTHSPPPRHPLWEKVESRRRRILLVSWRGSLQDPSHKINPPDHRRLQARISGISGKQQQKQWYFIARISY